MPFQLRSIQQTFIGHLVCDSQGLASEFDMVSTLEKFILVVHKSSQQIVYRFSDLKN